MPEHVRVQKDAMSDLSELVIDAIVRRDRVPIGRTPRSNDTFTVGREAVRVERGDGGNSRAAADFNGSSQGPFQNRRTAVDRDRSAYAEHDRLAVPVVERHRKAC